MRRDVRLYLLASALLLFALGVYSVLFNLFLVRLGYTPGFVGLINAVGSLGYALFCLVAGALGQRFGTRKALTAGGGLFAVAFLLLGMAESMPVHLRSAWLLASNALGWIAFALYMVNSNPFLMLHTTDEERHHAFSASMAMGPLSGFLGGLVGGFLPGLLGRALRVSEEASVPYALALMATGVVCAVAVPVMWRTREPGQSRVGPVARVPIGASLPLIVAIGVFGLFRMTGEHAARTFFNVYLDLGLGASTARIGVLFALAQLVAVPAAMAYPWLARRHGEFRAVLIGSIGIGVSLLPLALVRHWAAATFGLTGTIALGAMLNAALSVFSLQLVPERERSVMSAALNMAIGLSIAGTSLGGGAMIEVLGYRPLFGAGAFLTFAGALIFWAVFRVPRGAYARTPVEPPPAEAAGEAEHL